MFMRFSPAFILICILWSLYHVGFFHLNEVLKVADSFAYLQMGHFLSDFSSKWFGSWWFGFLYSLPLTIWNIFWNNEILSAQIVNLILFSISAYLLWKISLRILDTKYSYLVVILFFISPTLLHFNIHILSENIYLPLFLGLFLMILKLYDSFIIDSPGIRNKLQVKYVIYLACLIGLMYLTRAEAFIYILSIWIISFMLLWRKRFSLSEFLRLWILFFISFFLFISPYLFHLHSLTWEWGLTNKWASNLRQAELRGIERMDDVWFEQAVAELTRDNTKLIAWFAWGMTYTKPQIEWSLGEFIWKDPWRFFSRITQNQYKLFTRNIPEIFLWKSPKLFYWDDQRFTNILFFLWCLFPFFIILLGIYHLIKKEAPFFWTGLAFFIPAFLFFTLFFTLNRYFLIFLPLWYIVYVYGISQIHNRYLQTFTVCNIISILLLSTSVYYNVESPKDEYYALKKEAGLWLYEYCMRETLPINTFCEVWEDYTNEWLKIMERFPIVTYYSNSKIRFITPYTDSITDIYEYWIYNDIDILVVDSMDFKTYRPKLTKYLSETPPNFIVLKEFQDKKGQKVILYTLEK